MLNSKKFYGDIQGNVKPYIIKDTNNFDQPIVTYQANTGGVSNLPPNQLQLIVPDSSKLITINHSTGLLKTRGIYVDGNITNATSITSSFIGNLSGNATTVTNGVYLNNTGTQTINGNISVKQLDIDGTQVIDKPSSGGIDITATNLTITTIYATTTNSGSVFASGDISCRAITGGVNNSSGNFHIDNATSSGDMYLNYTNNNNLRYGNVPATS